MIFKSYFRCLVVLTVVLFVFFAHISSGCAQSVCDHVTLEWLNAQAPLPKDAKLVYKKERDSLCEVVLVIDGDLVPIYVGKDFILGGQMFKNGVSVTQQTMAGLSDIAEAEREKAREKEEKAIKMRKDFFKTHVKDLAGLVSLSFSPNGSSDKFIYVISDPACSHCKTLLNELEEMAVETGLTLKLVIYPILGDHSKTMAAHVICEGLGYGEYKALTMDKRSKGCEKADTRINQTLDLLQQAQISFVPLVVAQDGSWVVEGDGIGQVRQHLGLDKKADASQKSGKK